MNTKWSKELQERYVDDYLAEQEHVELAAWCLSVGVPLSTFKMWLREQTVLSDVRAVPKTTASDGTVLETEFVPAPRGWRVRPGAHPERFAAVEMASKKEPDLQERDIRILEDLRHDRCESLRIVAARHFGEVENPEAAALKRLRQLSASGWVRITDSGQTLVHPTRKAARALGCRPPRRIHPRHLAHHIATLEAIDKIRRDLEAQGRRVVPYLSPDGYDQPYRLEMHIQSADRRGTRRLGAGHNAYDMSPDAVIQVETAGGGVEEIAVEYFTKAYTKEQVVGTVTKPGKAALHGKYPSVIQVCDCKETAEKVRAWTGHDAVVL